MDLNMQEAGVEIACETHRWRRGTGRGTCDMQSLRKASVEKRYGQKYEGKFVEIACGKHRWKRATGSAMEDNPGNRLRKAWGEERNGKRSGGNIVEIASEKHRWIRDAGRDGRCGWEIGWGK